MGQVLTKNEGFSDFCEGWVPFLLEIKQKAGWLVGMYFYPSFNNNNNTQSVSGTGPCKPVGMYYQNPKFANTKRCACSY